MGRKPISSRGGDAPSNPQTRRMKLTGMRGRSPRNVGVSLCGAGSPLGSAAALLALPALASAYGWRAAFAVSSAFIALALVLWLAAPAVPAVPRTGTMRDALRCANCWLAALQHAAGIGVALASATWITVYLLREFALPLALSGLLGSSLLVLAVFARPFGGVLVTRGFLGTKAVMRLGDIAIVAGVGLLAIPGRPLPLALGGALLVGVGAGLPYAGVFTTADASLPAAPGAAQGLAAVGGTAGGVVGAPGVGDPVQTSGFGAAGAFAGPAAALPLVGTFAMRGEE